MKTNAFLFLNANKPWVYALAHALAEQYPTHVIRFYDCLNFLRLKPSWPQSQTGNHIKKTTCILPPGYAGRFEILFRQFMTIMINHWRDQIAGPDDGYPWVVVTYPYLAPWVRCLPGDHLIYYNLDEYTLYQPARTAHIRKNEDEMIRRASRIICLSQYQVESFRRRHPDCVSKIFHFPLGVQEAFINTSLLYPTEPRTVGYIGNLSDRIDWQLVYDVARLCPDLTFMFVGEMDNAITTDKSEWIHERDKVFCLTNVRYIKPVAQDMVAQYYWSFAANWIPYNIEHPFNNASCPTKIMDGIASGRPVISTAVPECKLYPEWIYITNSAQETIDILHKIFSDDTDLYSESAIDFVKQHTWKSRAHELLSLLS